MKISFFGLGICLSFCLISLPILATESVGIVGGTSPGGIGYGALIDSSGSVQILTNLPDLSGGENSINSVAMNSSGLSIMAGHQGGGSGFDGGPYVALVGSTGNVQSLLQTSGIDVLHACSINSSGNSLAVGSNGSPIGYRIDFFDPENLVSFTNLPSGLGGFGTAAINNTGFALTGGNGVVAQGFLFEPDSVDCSVSSLGVTASDIYRVAINSSGISILGGEFFGAGLCEFYDSSRNFLTSGPVPGPCHAVSINDSNVALAGGINGSIPYLQLFTPLGIPVSLSGDPLPTQGQITSVDLNNIGFGVIGGQDSTNQAAYAAFIYPSGALHTISGLPSGSSNTVINSVSINEWGVALLGGTSDGTTGYAALATLWGTFSELDVSASDTILSVSIRNYFPFTKKLRQLLGEISTVTGNNLIFGEYITSEAPGKIRYFLPSVFKGNLSDALQSAAPTRNALSVFAVNNNMFFLNQSLALHSRNRFQFHQRSRVNTHEKTSLLESLPAHKNSDHLLAFTELPQEEKDSEALPEAATCSLESEKKCSSKRARPYTLWFEPIGALVKQKEQRQTVAFTPQVGGFILALENSVVEEAQVGAGAAYTYTHISEEQNQGWSNINQEYVFLYGGWSNRDWYVDAAVWGGLFQTDQVRLIHLTGYDFRSTSTPFGTQICPHLEFGYNASWQYENCYSFVIDPFAMVDWPNSWQKRYKETGSGPFNIVQEAQHSSFLRTEVGCRFYETVFFDTCTLTLEEKGSYIYRNPFHIGSIHAFLVGSPGAFTLETLSSTQNLWSASLSLILEPLSQLYPYGSLTYQGEFGRKYRSHQMTAEISWSF